ncbi:hypothetical protein, partial [Robertmurraya kyonggiensis]|uniref:hypothetical protein n=1 Tax=Robertmurraya kyonggiensis TaxID=1037680 RepID=UPI0019D56937
MFISGKIYLIIHQFSLTKASLRKYKYDTLGFPKVKCYTDIFCALAESLSKSDIINRVPSYVDLRIDVKKCQQAFLAPLPGKQLAKDIVELFDNLYRFITTNLRELTPANSR